MCDLISRARVCLLDVKEAQQKGTDREAGGFPFQMVILRGETGYLKQIHCGVTSAIDEEKKKGSRFLPFNKLGGRQG